MAQTVKEKEKENRLDGADDPRCQLPIRVEWQKRWERASSNGRRNSSVGASRTLTPGASMPVGGRGRSSR